tara:strand:- start:188 stop:430 length:243 start_codon:yes stop_codon:yes gene_type:complete
MKLTNTELIVLGALIIALIQFLKTDNTQQNNNAITLNREIQDFDNAQGQLYSWVEEGTGELEDIWNEELNGLKTVYYNDK